MRPISSKLSRRTFLSALAGAAALPFIPRKARAAEAILAGRAEHLIILYAGGGLRGAPLFFGDAAFEHNPYGEAPNAGASEWIPGALLGGPRIALPSFGTGVELPSAAELSADIALLAGVDHLPAGTAIVDHLEADQRLTTASTGSGEAGLLSIVHREHSLYKANARAFPPVDLGGSNFARATGNYAANRPLEISTARIFQGRSDRAETAQRSEWMKNIVAGRDEKFLDARAAARDALENLASAKNSGRIYGAHLRNPALDLLGAPDATLGGASNAQLLEVLGAGPMGMSKWGLETAFALRACQLGSPAVSVHRYLYDTHSDERDSLPEDGGDLARQIAGVNFLLKRLDDGRGRALWESTVVVVVSEVNRDNVDPNTGFNSGGGSDHRGTPASRNQLWPLFGGPVAGAGRIFGRLDPQTLATIDGPATPVASVQATLLALLGIDPAPYFSGPLLAGIFR